MITIFSLIGKKPFWVNQLKLVLQPYHISCTTVKKNTTVGISFMKKNLH